MKTNYNSLTDNDINQLHGFFMHKWGVHEGTTKQDYAFYADLLDSLNIGWHIQNTVAILAETRANIFYYFKPLLMKAISLTR